jgi:FAD/FMN-containing dehydrogenase
MDYMDLFIGSEGILGVVTEATVRLLPAPGEMLSGVVFFVSTDDALAAVDAWRPVPGLRMLEYMDAGSLDLLRARYTEIPAEARAALLIEQETDADDWVDRVIDAGGLEDSWFGLSPADRERFRAFRHALPEAVNETVRRRGLLKMGTDFAVPIDRNREMMRVYAEVLAGQQHVIFGHIGDAHVHANLLPQTEADAARARDLIVELARRAVAFGGTVAAEHGLGKRKAHLLEIQYTPDEIEHMRAVKRRLDPQWLLGRGTLLSV